MIYAFLGGFVSALLPAFIVMVVWCFTSALTTIEE